MKILFVIPSYKPAYVYGGPTVSVSVLAEQIARLGHEITVYTTNANGDVNLDVETNREVMVDGVKVFYFEKYRNDAAIVSPQLWRHLARTANEFDVVVVHSWWTILIIVAGWICKKKGSRPIFSPKGSFNKHILQHRNAFKKKLVHQIFGRSILGGSRIHATTEYEAANCRKFVPDAAVSTIYNSISFPGQSYQRRENKVFSIGFLSRLDKKKGLDFLIKALGRVEFPFRLSIAGDGEAGYIDQIKDLARDEGILEQIDWLGWKNRDEKFPYLSALDLFVLPSHSENFGMVVVESLSVGTPVLISDHVGLCGYVEENNFGWSCAVDSNALSAKLAEAYVDAEKRRRINVSSPQKVAKDFNEVSLAKEFVEFLRAES